MMVGRERMRKHMQEEEDGNWQLHVEGGLDQWTFQGKEHVMKFIGTAFLALAVVLAFLPVQADETSMEAFYSDCIMEKSDQREQLARRLQSSTYRALLDYGRRAADQARFYEANKDKLVGEMLEKKVARNRHEVECFLIKAYFDEKVSIPIQTASENK
jgi:hypothetical protein